MKAEALGAFIRTLRSRKGMTQAELAMSLHVTDKAVSKWERGQSYPDITLFPKLAKTLDVTVADLLYEGTDGGTPSRLTQIYRSSHDVRTPLQVIMGCTDLLERYHEEPELLKRYLDSIRISAEYLLEVCESGKKTDGIEIKLETGVSSVNKATATYDFSGKRILIAEDIEVNREIAAQIMKNVGAEVEFARNGFICVEKIKAAAPGFYHLILMDIQMPVMDGLEATRQIRKMGIGIPIVAMTANVQEEDRKAALDAGMDDFVEKPLDVERLYSKIDKLL